MSGSNYTTTPNLGLYKPAFNADVGSWGNHWNTNADTLDGLFPSGASGTFLPIAGGTLSGGLVGTTGDFATSFRSQGVLTVGLSSNNYLTLTPGSTTSNVAVISAPAGTAGVAFTGGPLAAGATNFGRGFTYSYSGQTVPDVTRIGLWANNNISGTFAGATTLAAVGAFSASGMNISAPSATVPVVNISGNAGGASAASGQWEALEVNLNDAASSNDKAGGGQGVWVALQVARRASQNQGGTGPTGSAAYGANWGIDVVNTITSGGTNLYLQNGIEVNQAVQAGGSVFRRAGIQLSTPASHAVRGTFDYGISFLLASGCPGYIAGIEFGGGTSPTSPLATDSRLLALRFAQDRTATANIGIDFNDATFTTAAMRSPGFTVDNAGTVRVGPGYITATGSGISVDAKGSVGTGTPTINAGGVNWAVNNVADDAYGGTYRVTTVSGGAITGVAVMVQPYYPTTSPPATLTLTGRPNNSGTGAVLNGSWSTTQTTLALNPSGGSITYGGPVGATTYSGGINFGSTLDSGSTSFANHIGLFGTQYGIGVTGGRFNIISAGSIVFINQSAAVDIFSVSNAAVATFGNTTAHNRFTITPGSVSTNAIVLGQSGTGGVQVNGNMGFNSTAPIARPTVTGAKASNAALASLLTALASYGLVTDSTTA